MLRYLLIIAVFAAFVAAVLTVVLLLLRLPRRARAAGYGSVSAYLSAAPQTDEDKRDAADLALKGLVLCLLGLVFPPLLLFGVIPFFYGARKVLYASMGLGLAEDPDQNGR